MPNRHPRALVAAIVASALLCYGADWGLPPLFSYVFKPLTTLLIIAAAQRAGVPLWVRVGLGLSLVGDVALLFPGGFVAGLVGFLLAHLAYLRAFTQARRFAAWWPAFAAYGVAAVGMLALLWPGVPAALHVPVIAYVVCLASMAAQAGVVGWLGRGTPLAADDARLALGGLLFLGSDSCIAFNKFAGPLPAAAALVMPTYWAAQWCIANWRARRIPSN
ncbi:MAG: lysoplasmalogenase [Pelomonas sp.]|nr:lysoplasmalogenase [Roseateles sp.]